MNIDSILARQVALARLLIVERLIGRLRRAPITLECRTDKHASERMIWPECAGRPYGVGAGTLLVMMYLRSSLLHSECHRRDSTSPRE